MTAAVEPARIIAGAAAQTITCVHEYGRKRVTAWLGRVSCGGEAQYRSFGPHVLEKKFESSID